MKTAIITLVLYLVISWALTVGIIKLICLCFGFTFTLLAATGIWLAALLLRTFFTKGSD